MTERQAIERRVRELVAEILELDDVANVRPDYRLREDLGMDSLGSMELLSRISEELELDLDMESAMDIRTVGDATRFVDQSYADRHGLSPILA